MDSILKSYPDNTDEAEAPIDDSYSPMDNLATTPEDWGMMYKPERALELLRVGSGQLQCRVP